MLLLYVDQHNKITNVISETSKNVFPIGDFNICLWIVDMLLSSLVLGRSPRYTNSNCLILWF